MGPNTTTIITIAGTVLPPRQTATMLAADSNLTVTYLVPRRPSAPDAESAFWVGRLAPRCDFLVRMSNFVCILYTNHVAI